MKNFCNFVSRRVNFGIRLLDEQMSQKSISNSVEGPATMSDFVIEGICLKDNSREVAKY